MRWSQVLFSQGFGTRRECEALLLAGRVRHADRLIDDPDEDVDTRGLEFEVEGRPWPYAESALILLHKPAGYECSQRPGASPGVMTLLPPPLRRRGVQSVGRLDVDTTGLLLLTDDGPLQARLSHPRWKLPKTYYVQVEHIPDEAALAKLRRGVSLNDGPTQPADVERVAEPAWLWPRDPPIRKRAAIPTAWLRITIREGRNRQVRRMTAAVGHPTLRLIRWSVGPWDIATLPPGQHREAPAGEIGRLFAGRSR